VAINRMGLSGLNQGCSSEIVGGKFFHRRWSTV